MVFFKRFCICLLFTLLTYGYGAAAEEFSSGADYLQTAIRDIVIKNSEQSIVSLMDNQARIVTSSPLRRVVTPSSPLYFDGHRRFSGGEPEPQLDNSYHHENSYSDYTPHEQQHQQQPQPQVTHNAHSIPDPPALTKGELAALYEAAVSNGHAVHMSGPTQHPQDSLPLQAALHEVHDTPVHQRHPQQHHQPQVPDASQDSYYYYYYPLKSFLDGFPAQHVPKPTQVPKDHHYKTPVLTSYNTHLHNVKIEPIRTITELAPAKGKKGIEPLFMAISSFVGMAVVFMFSMVLFPRLTGGLKGVFNGGKGGGPTPKGKNNNKNNLKNNNKNNLKNNNKNNNNNFNHNKKKPRLFDEYKNWPRVIANFIDKYGCMNCNHRSLGPYRNTLSRTTRARFQK